MIVLQSAFTQLSFTRGKQDGRDARLEAMVIGFGYMLGIAIRG